MKRYRVILSIIGLFSCLAQFAIDIYTPSVPAIALQFHVSLNAVQWSISIYAVGLCLSMLVYGPLSDIIGRRKPLLLGLFLMMVGSLICALSKNIETLIVGRLVQGLGAGAIAVLWRAMMRDLFSGDELAKYSSYLVPVIVGIMAVAPLLGGYFQHYISWRASFVFLLLYAIVSSLLILWQYKEGKLPSNKMNIGFAASALAISTLALLVATCFESDICGLKASQTPTKSPSYLGGFKYHSGTSLWLILFVPAQPAISAIPINKIICFFIPFFLFYYLDQIML